MKKDYNNFVSSLGFKARANKTGFNCMILILIFVLENNFSECVVVPE